MQNAKVFVVDDQKGVIEILRRLLSFSSHSVVLQASTIKEATTLITNGELEKNSVNLAFVDCNLPEYEEGPEKNNGGFVVADAIRNRNLNIKIIAYTSVWKSEASYGDVHLEKPAVSKQIFETIESL